MEEKGNWGRRTSSSNHQGLRKCTSIHLRRQAIMLASFRHNSGLQLIIFQGSVCWKIVKMVAGALYQCICSLAFSSVHQFWLWILSSFAWVFAFALLAVRVSICVHSDVWEWHRKKSIHWDFQSEDVSWNNVDIPHFLKCKAFQHSSWFSFHICTKAQFSE